MKTLLTSLLLISSFVHADDIFTNEFEALVASRVNNLELKDPHLYLDFFGCNDITDALNQELNNQINADNDADGFLDISLVTQFKTDQPNYINSRSLEVNLIDALCTDPLSCAVNTTVVADLLTSTSLSNNCLTPIAGTTSAYTSTVTSTTGPCYATEPQDALLNLGGIVIPLQAFQQASRYPSGITLDQGLQMGFISESAAMNVVIPDQVPLVGGETLFNLLPGGGVGCGIGDEPDIGPDGVTSGWWFYFNSTSDLVELTSN